MKIVQKLKETIDTISWADIADYIYDGVDFHIPHTILQDILQICNDRIRIEINKKRH